MYTGVYFPQDGLADDSVVWIVGDYSSWANRFDDIEGPSYSVRLIVFEMSN